MIKYITGSCPVYNKYITVKLEYLDFDFANTPNTQHKKDGYSCDTMKFNGCDMQICPIFEQAPQTL